MKSLGLLKDVEIERLALNIKKLKAERVFRIRKELETYNEMLRKFKEYRETASAKFEENNLNRPEDPSQTAIRRKLLKTKDSIKEILLAKLNLIEKGAEKNSRLTEEQLIEHEMLILDEEFPFKDAEIQVNILPHTKDFGANAIVPTQSVEIETDEILQIFSMESDQEELTNFPKLILTNEDNEESIKFPGLQKSLEKDLKNNKNPRAIFQFRAKMEKVSQTDDKIFLEIMKKEEDEITNWMREDREKYLRGVQRQIFQKKGELSKVNDLIAKNRSKLGDSMQVEDILQMSIGSNSEQIDVLIDLEIENLRKNGILGEEIEIESWKQGYYFGYDKGKIEGYAEGERLGLEKADLDKDLVSSFDYGETNEITRKRSARKSTLGVSDFKKAKNFTKVQEFKFQRKNSRISTAKIEHKQHLLKSFLSESLKEIVKNTKMSRKMTLKTISTIYSSMISKKATHAYNLADFTFEEFCSKYGQKVVASKKFVDFVAALLKYPDSRKAINFSKLLGISHKLGLEDYIRPKETFAFMSVLLEKIENSTLGIVIGIDETSDYQFIPKIRAVECTKELISPYVDNGKLNAILEIIDKNSHPDPKKINKSGIIDQELLQEILLNEFDGHYKNVIDRLGMLFGGIMMEARPLQVYKLDFIMLLRVVSPLKFASFIGVNDPIEVLNRICESNPLVNYESTEKLMDLCIKYNLLQNYEFETGTTLEQARNIITNGLKENQNLLRYVFTHREEFNLTEEYSLIWEDRLNKIQENEFFHPGLLVMIWGVLLSEIKRITSKNSENIAGN